MPSRKKNIRKKYAFNKKEKKKENNKSWNVTNLFILLILKKKLKGDILCMMSIKTQTVARNFTSYYHLINPQSFIFLPIKFSRVNFLELIGNYS